MNLRLYIAIIVLGAAALGVRAAPAEGKAGTYSQVHAIFAQHCLACHDSKEAEGGLVLETHETIMAGGDSGEAIEPGNAEKSVLVRQIERREKPFMPPPKKGEKLSDGEIAIIRSWIDAGAPKAKAGEVAVAVAGAATTGATTRALPHIDAKGTPRRAVQAIAYEPKMDLLAVARGNEVEIRSAKTQAVLRKFSGHKGNVNCVVFTSDGTCLLAAAGQAGRSGEVRLWNVGDGVLLHTFEGHADAIYSLALSPDGKTFATGSYDQKIILWDLPAKKKLLDLEGHNGAVFALSFRNDGKVLASASADRTVKLWEVASGKRLDTRPESLKDQLTLSFTPDGQKVLSAGVDNRVRVWQVSASAAEGSNPLVGAHFAHEGAILKLAISADGKTLATSADDRTVKIWNLADFKQKLTLPMQPDWPLALAFAEKDSALVVGRQDGTLGFYDVASGKPIMPTKPAMAVKPELTGLDPRGIERGHTIKVKLSGKNLTAANGVTTTSPKVTAKLLADAKGEAAWVELTAAADAPTGPFDLTLTSAGGNSGAQKFVVDDLPQVESQEPNHTAAQATLATTLPVTLGGKFAVKAEADYFAIEGKAGQKLVLDVAAKRIGSKASLTLDLVDAAGRTLATGEDVDGDPILEAALPADGRYYVRATEQTGAASEEHFYRIAAGDFQVVTGCFPLAVAPSAKCDVQLLGFNIGGDAGQNVVNITAPAGGEMDVPVDRGRYRVRRQPKVIVGSANETAARVANSSPQTALQLAVPGGASGRLIAAKAGGNGGGYYRVSAKANQQWIIETQAARRGSPVDTRIEVLWPDGKPVQRLLLQAVRDSYLTFRGTDANQTGTRLANWEEMDLDQLVYMNGEVVKIIRMPQGPDSDAIFYAIGGKRRCYFDTSATSHALEDKAYIVEPHAPGEKLSANGLPAFPLYFENDDDSLRQLGPDSRLLFTAPADGEYLVRVSDVRNFGGERYVYRLVVREAMPDFSVSLEGVNPSIPPGSGRNFTVRVNRIDEFDGPVRVDISDVPAGFAVSSPIIVEAGHTEAKGTIYAAADAKSPDPKAPAVKFVASALVGGKQVMKPAMDVGKLSVGGTAQVIVRLEPFVEGNSATKPSTMPSTIEVVPGQLTKAWLRVQRNGHKGLVTFEVENLPHGMIVADIGLNGVLIPEGQSERLIFLQCAPWVKEMTHPCHARANEAGNPTSAPVLVHVRGVEAARR